MRDLLRRLDCQVAIAPVRLGIGCGEMTARMIENALADLTEAESAPAVVIAHSRGGQLARSVAVRRPELLRGLITLGAPLTRMLAVHPLLLAQVAVLGIAGALGVPGLLRPGCRWGACCAGLRADLTAPFPESLPFLSMYSRDDRVVDWRSSCDPAARHREVPASHGGLIWDPSILATVVDELVHMVTGVSPAVHDGADRRSAA
ncbi:alpha/beta fold hydrolase [Amycolatopsis speibonae]|uniref:Alpha/beta fold hydrolase n=1 Tax=Amycolatopsis speibonae TaxID=1450224 RepID=A0ABV7PDG4_9PSEU